MAQTLQQQRAKFALDQIRARAHLSKMKKEEFAGYTRGLPAMILMNGLGQAAAFYRSKGETHGDLYELISEWLRRPGQPYHDKKDLLDGITQGDMHAYRIAQAEALALLDWVKKFANAFKEDAP